MLQDGLPERKMIEQRHADKRAETVDVSSHNWTSGSQAIEPALRAPYLYLESWLSARCQGKSVLDFGCGDGLHSMHAARAGAHVMGIDISPKSIELARHRAAKEGVAATTDFVVGDCENLPFPDQTFDIVLSCQVLPALELGRAMREIARVLKPAGGAIILDVLGHNPVINLRRAMSVRAGRRTAWTRDRILKMPDLGKIGAVFSSQHVEFFDLTTVMLSPLLHVPGGGALRPLAPKLAKLDRWLLRWSILRPMAFKFVITLAGPIQE